jgi:hypothetical protein
MESPSNFSSEKGIIYHILRYFIFDEMSPKVNLELEVLHIFFISDERFSGIKGD